MGIVKEGDTVKVHYVAKTGDQIIFDSKSQVNPLQFKLGSEEIIPSFEEALIGMQSGDSKTIRVPADKAFGPYMEELISNIKRAELPTDLKLEVGQQLQIQQPDGSVILVTVTDISNEEVTFDANHPLAGKDITFDIKLVDII